MLILVNISLTVLYLIILFFQRWDLMWSPNSDQTRIFNMTERAVLAMPAYPKAVSYMAFL